MEVVSVSVHSSRPSRSPRSSRASRVVVASSTVRPSAHPAGTLPARARRRRRDGRAWAATGLALTSALLLSACATGGEPAPGASSEQTGASSAASTASGPVYAEHPAESRLQVKGLDLATYLPDVRLDVRSSLEPRFHGTWPSSPAAPAFARALDQEVTAQIDRWAQEHEPPSAQDRARAEDEGLPASLAELNVQPDLTAAGPDVAAVRLYTFEFAGASTGSSYRTLWYDAGQVADGPDLFTGPGWRSLVEAAHRELGQNPETFEGAPADPDGADVLVPAMGESEMDSINFTPAGDAVIEFDEYAVAPGSAGPIEVVVPADEVADWLSPFGERARAAAAAPAPLTAAEASGEPTATDQPSASEPADTPDASAPSAPAAPSSRQPAGGAVDCAVKKCVALTFDDGPGRYTGTLLDSLKSRGVPATFFVLGPNVAANPGVVQRMAAEGHQVASHTWSHRRLTTLSAQELTSEVQRTAEQIRRATGSAPTVMRPPYGAVDAPTRQRLAQMSGTGAILWSVDTLDWKTKSPAATLRAVQQQVGPGGIILMHDIHQASVQAVPQVVDWLTAQGYTLVTVDQLLGSTQPGQAYSQGPRP